MDREVTLRGRHYLIETTPEGRTFAQVYELLPRRMSGVVAHWLEEVTGTPHYTYDQAYLSDEEIMALVLELGHKFSRSSAWKNLYDWAYFRSRELHVDLR